MLEARGNMWDFEADAYVITTNGFVKNNGEAVMGRGCAREAARMWPSFPALLGKHITENGNMLGAFEPEKGKLILTMPVKHHWRERADMALMVISAVDLVGWVSMSSLSHVIMPRPGCGNGHLNWNDVGPVMGALLDDRFTVVTF